MGAKPSRPTYPPLNPLFQDIGCVSLGSSDMADNRLDKAPFYQQAFDVRSVKGMMDPVKKITTYDAMTSEVIRRINEMPIVYAPIYLLTAFDSSQSIVRCRLYFPSMSKLPTVPDGETDPCKNPVNPANAAVCYIKAPNYMSMGNAHLWMNHLLYGAGYNVKAYAACVNRITPPKTPNTDPSKSFMYGCEKKGGQCRLSVKAYRGMGIYNKKKPPKKNAKDYPFAYYHAYQLNTGDPRISKNISANSPPGLVRNIMPPFLEIIPGCRYALISPSKTYIVVLSKRALTVFRNAGNEDYNALCVQKKRMKSAQVASVTRFRGGYDTRMVIEDDKLNVYSKTEAGGSELNVYSITISNTTDGGPFTIVLNDKGAFEVYNVNNQNVTDPSLTSLNNGTNGLGLFNLAEERRRRILNLKAYLRLRGYIIPVDSPASNSNASSAGAPSKPNPGEYNSSIDYRDRLEKLFGYLLHAGRITQEEYDYQMAKLRAERRSVFNIQFPGLPDFVNDDLFGDLDEMIEDASDTIDGELEDSYDKATAEEDKDKKEDDAYNDEQKKLAEDEKNSFEGTTESVSNDLSTYASLQGEGEGEGIIEVATNGLIGGSTESEYEKAQRLLQLKRILRLLDYMKTVYRQTHPNSNAQAFYDTNKELAMRMY